MIRKIMIALLFIFLINTPGIEAQGNIQLELFDIQKGQVIKTAPSSLVIQKEARSYITGIDNIYTKLSPIPQKGFMIKIPLEPSIHIDNKWLNSKVDEIIIIFSKEEKPYLLTFDADNHPHVFTFTGGNINVLIETFDMDPKDF